MSEALNDKLGKYELRGTLGRGAMGTVYDGWDPIIARRVAIKTVRIPDAGDEEALEALARFKREAQAAGSLNHPNIVGVHDYGETPELAYIVMEFVDGRTLKQALEGEARLTVADATRLVGDVLDGLAYSHARGVVHRDIKPANIMLTRDGRAKIADFGIARIESSSLTQAGTVLGTPAYMSPEQFMGQTVDRRTDIYSTGILLYQLLTGERPFEGSLTAIMHKVLNTTPPPPSALSVAVPGAVDAVVARAMARRPEDRFDSADDFAVALRGGGARAIPSAALEPDDGTIVALPPSALTTPPPAVRPAPSAPPPPPASKRGKVPLLALGAAFVAILAGAGGYFALSGHGESSVAPAPAPQTSAKLPEFLRHPEKAQAPPAATAATVATATAPPAAAPATSIDEMPCTLITRERLSGAESAVSGAAGQGTPIEALRTAIDHALDPAPAKLSLAPVPNLYCPILDVLRGARSSGAPSDALSAELVGGSASLANNDVIAISFTMPDFDGVLQLAYVSSDGSVAPLEPPGTVARHYRAGDRIVLGRPAAGFAGWHVGPPFGNDLIVLVVSSIALGLPPLSSNENVASYATAMRTALSGARAAGATISTTVIPLETRAN